MVKDENGLDDRSDAVGAAAELRKKAPALQSGHGLLAEAADLGVRAVGVCQTSGVSRVVEGYWRAAESRPSKVISKAFKAVFQRIVQRAWPLPVGSSDMIAM